MENFFVIDSTNLCDVDSRLYGFALINGSVYTCVEELDNMELSGDGAYILVRKYDNKIVIQQDFIGSHGLYLYKEREYFAISNSFWGLIDHVKCKHKITLNRDYATAFISADLCAISYSETLVNEIQVLGRNVKVEIPLNGIPVFHNINYYENTLVLDSFEGICKLDAWYEKWTAIIRNLASNTSNIQVDLSGGFDTRIVLGLFLGSGIDMKKVLVSSIKDELHTHKEDYEIASAIADYYDFALNNSDYLVNSHRYYTTMQEVLDNSYYLKLGFHKQMYYRKCWKEKPHFLFSGSGGECVRAYWDMSQKDYINTVIKRCIKRYGMSSFDAIGAVRRNLQRTFNQIKEKKCMLDLPILDEDMTLNLYRETRCRNHFGKDIIENLFANCFKYTPLLDPQLHMLQLNSKQCKDKNLLMALIFVRYNPDLLKFKFEGGRAIESKTIEYARELNARFPYYPREHAQEVKETIVRPVVCAPHTKTAITGRDEVNDLVKEIFVSRNVRTAFTTEFDESIYENIRHDIETRAYQPLQDAHAVIAISKVIQDCSMWHNIVCNSVADQLCYDLTPFRNTLRSHMYLYNYITARVDIRNKSQTSNKIEVSNLDDFDVKIMNPKWLDSNGYGYVFESCRGSLDMDIICEGEGILEFVFRGKDVRNINNARIPMWIDLQTIILDGKEYLSHPCPIWHDSPMCVSLPVTVGKNVHLHFEWEPHDERKYEIICQKKADESNKMSRSRLYQLLRKIKRKVKQ